MTTSHTILLDSTVLIDTLRNRNDRRALLAQWVASGHQLATSAVSIAEVFGGLRPGEEERTHALLETMEWIPVSAWIAERAGTMKAALRRKGQTRSITDMMVAATALEMGCPLATDNVRDFHIDGLQLCAMP